METDSNGLSIPPNLEREDVPLHFVETLKRLEALTSHLLCVKCCDVPRGKVFVLGCCNHKYCEKCARGLAGKECVSCGERGIPKDVKPDLFSTNLLKEIPKVYRVLKGLQEMGCRRNEDDDEHPLSPPQLNTQTQKRNKADEKVNQVSDYKDNDETIEGDLGMEIEPIVDEVPVVTNRSNSSPMKVLEKENKEPATSRKSIFKRSENPVSKASAAPQVNNYDVYEFNDCTPVGSSQNGPASPDVLEETPQHKPRVSLTLSARTSHKKNQSKGVRNLDFPSEKKSDKQSNKKTVADNEPPSTKNDSPSKKPDAEFGFASDEELFRSQQSCQEQNDDGGGGVPLPVLTPNTTVTRSKAKDQATKRKGHVAKHSSLPGSDSGSEEYQLPALTPYGQPEKKNIKSEVASAVAKTKRTTRGRQLFKSESSSENVSLAKGKSKPPKAAAESKKAKTPAASEPKKKNVPARKRRHSTGLVETVFTDDDDDDFKASAKSSSGRQRARRASAASSSSSASIRKTSLPLSSPVPSLNESFVGMKGGKEKRNAKGETGLHVACRAGQLDKVQTLLDTGSDVEAKDNAGWTPLHEVINSKRSSVDIKISLIRLLFKHGCNINAFGGPDQETALHSAVVSGLEKVVEVLLELGASPNIRNNLGQLPKDVAFNDVIVNMVHEKTGRSGLAPTHSISRSSGSSKNNFESTMLTTPDDDPAVLQVMIAKAVLYFNYDISEDDVAQIKFQLGLKVAKDLTHNVTHIVHKVGKNKGLVVPMSMEYLYGLARGMWQVNSEWIEQSLQSSKCLSPTRFEIIGYEGCNDCETFQVPIMCRANHEKGNPGLLDGFTFFLYRMCGYAKKGTDLTKNDLISLITAAGGKITNREPNPNDIDPLDGPQRFHTQKGVDPANPSKFVLTTHIILYDEKVSLPSTKMYKMEHVKTLKSDWLIESLANFRLEDPENFID